MWFFIVLTSTVLINVFVDGMSEPSISREEFDNLKATVQQQENAIMRQTEMIRDLESMFTVSMELTKKQGDVSNNMVKFADVQYTTVNYNIGLLFQPLCIKYITEFCFYFFFVLGMRIMRS